MRVEAEEGGSGGRAGLPGIDLPASSVTAASPTRRTGGSRQLARPLLMPLDPLISLPVACSTPGHPRLQHRHAEAWLVAALSYPACAAVSPHPASQATDTPSMPCIPPSHTLHIALNPHRAVHLIDILALLLAAHDPAPGAPGRRPSGLCHFGGSRRTQPDAAPQVTLSSQQHPHESSHRRHRPPERQRAFMRRH